MTFFTSEYECKLDAKGRLVLPARIKSNLPGASGNELVIQRGFDPCLILYPMVEFNKIYSKIAGLSEFNEEYRKFQRNFFRGSSTVELDANARLLVPKPMLQYAQLKKEVIVIGMGNKIEIWNPELYNQQLIDDPAEFSDMARKLLDE
ncbi:MAG: division/cell wall cluster transcriptional repressor MraZ [Cyclobacteriaceae bacterium]|nr:division/cell wall cluster transcriptional repressor MraZ [Cyclobacteriaceae bacterium]